MTQTDYKSFAPGLHVVPEDYIPITPDDLADLPYLARGLLNAGAGDITVVVRTAKGGTTNRTLPIAAGATLLGLFTRVLATGTTVGADLRGIL